MYLLRKWWTRTSSRKCSPSKSSCSSSAKSSTSMYPTTMSWAWRNSGQFFHKTKSSCPTCQTRLQRIDFLIALISGMWRTLCRMIMCRKSLNTPATSVWVHRRNQTKAKPLRSQTSGGTGSMHYPLSAVSFWCQLSALLTWTSSFVQSIRERPFISSSRRQSQYPKTVSAENVLSTA